MRYKLYIPEETERQIENAIRHVAVSLKNPEAASGIADDISEIYDFLENDAEVMAFCSDDYLRRQGYRMILLKKHRYLFIYRVDRDVVYVAGFFHMLENYAQKL